MEKICGWPSVGERGISIQNRLYQLRCLYRMLFDKHGVLTEYFALNVLALLTC